MHITIHQRQPPRKLGKLTLKSTTNKNGIVRYSCNTKEDKRSTEIKNRGNRTNKMEDLSPNKSIINFNVNELSNLLKYKA